MSRRKRATTKTTKRSTSSLGTSYSNNKNKNIHTSNGNYGEQNYDEYDMIVIGAGASGMFAAGTASSFGCKALLVEKHNIDDSADNDNANSNHSSDEEKEQQQFNLCGDCTNSACVPSKAIRCAAQVAHFSSKVKVDSDSASQSYSQSQMQSAAARGRYHAGDTTQVPYKNSHQGKY